MKIAYRAFIFVFCDGCIGFFMIWKNQPHIRQRGIGNPNPVKSAKESKSWKEFTALEMVLQMKRVITELVSRIIRLTKNLSTISLHKWEYRLILFKTINFLQIWYRNFPIWLILVSSQKLQLLQLWKSYRKLTPVSIFYWSKIIWLDIFYI